MAVEGYRHSIFQISVGMRPLGRLAHEKLVSDIFNTVEGRRGQGSVFHVRIGTMTPSSVRDLQQPRDQVPNRRAT